MWPEVTWWKQKHQHWKMMYDSSKSLAEVSKKQKKLIKTISVGESTFKIHYIWLALTFIHAWYGYDQSTIWNGDTDLGTKWYVVVEPTIRRALIMAIRPLIFGTILPITFMYQYTTTSHCLYAEGNLTTAILQIYIISILFLIYEEKKK